MHLHDRGSKSKISGLADKILTILDRSGYEMSANDVRRSANMDNASFERAMKFLVEFNLVEYNANDGIIRLSKHLHVTKRHPL